MNNAAMMSEGAIAERRRKKWGLVFRELSVSWLDFYHKYVKTACRANTVADNKQTIGRIDVFFISSSPSIIPSRVSREDFFVFFSTAQEPSRIGEGNLLPTSLTNRTRCPTMEEVVNGAQAT